MARPAWEVGITRLGPDAVNGVTETGIPDGWTG